jgi:hypothetical protein
MRVTIFCEIILDFLAILDGLEYIKKEDCLPTTQSLLNLKSNTMKNTVQRYCFF